MHPLDLINIGENYLDELRRDAEHRRLQRVARGTGRTAAPR